MKFDPLEPATFVQRDNRFRVQVRVDSTSSPQVAGRTHAAHWIRRAHHRQADPAFGQALRQATQGGVNVHAWRCQVSLTSIQLLDQVPVDL
jgi:DNA-binding sugar fermentation-stimulating protein